MVFWKEDLAHPGSTLVSGAKIYPRWFVSLGWSQLQGGWWLQASGKLPVSRVNNSGSEIHLDLWRASVWKEDSQGLLGSWRERQMGWNVVFSTYSMIDYILPPTELTLDTHVVSTCSPQSAAWGKVCLAFANSGDKRARGNSYPDYNRQLPTTGAWGGPHALALKSRLHSLPVLLSSASSEPRSLRNSRNTSTVSQASCRNDFGVHFSI